VPFVMRRFSRPLTPYNRQHSTTPDHEATGSLGLRRLLCSMLMSGGELWSRGPRVDHAVK